MSKAYRPGKRFLLLPGKIQSKSDGQEHYVSAGKLAQLYHVNPEHCVIWTPGMERDTIRHLLPLTPRFHGDYDAHFCDLLLRENGRRNEIRRQALIWHFWYFFFLGALIIVLAYAVDAWIASLYGL